jgi:ATP-binding cassette subfamily B protein
MDGHDVRNISLETLRTNIGFVPQEPFIFSDTIRNNVLFGRSNVSEEDLEAVLRVADIMDEIQALESGLDTVLGERGITLSGGQRQRLTIARALIPDPSIMIFDDALSMVDTRTEERILNQIMKIRRNKTNLIVSHRISTISRADRIVVIEHGELVEQGSHYELIELGRVYARLYRRQEFARELEVN